MFALVFFKMFPIHEEVTWVFSFVCAFFCPRIIDGVCVCVCAHGKVIRESMPLVGPLTGDNFGLYERQGLPMLLLFLDLSNARNPGAAPDAGGRVGGESGGVSNDDLLDEFREASKDHAGRLAFVYLDGNKWVVADPVGDFLQARWRGGGYGAKNKFSA